MLLAALRACACAASAPARLPRRGVGARARERRHASAQKLAGTLKRNADGLKKLPAPASINRAGARGRSFGKCTYRPRERVVENPLYSRSISRRTRRKQWPRRRRRRLINDKARAEWFILFREQCSAQLRNTLCRPALAPLRNFFQPRQSLNYWPGRSAAVF